MNWVYYLATIGLARVVVGIIVLGIIAGWGILWWGQRKQKRKAVRLGIKWGKGGD